MSPPAGYIGTKGTIGTISKTDFESGNTSLFQCQTCMNSLRGHHLKIKSIPECEEVNPVLQKGKVVRFKLSGHFKRPNTELLMTFNIFAEFNLRLNE